MEDARGEDATEYWSSHIVLHIEDDATNRRLVERVFERRPAIELIAAAVGRLALAVQRQVRAPANNLARAASQA